MTDSLILCNLDKPLSSLFFSSLFSLSLIIKRSSNKRFTTFRLHNDCSCFLTCGMELFILQTERNINLYLSTKHLFRSFSGHSPGLAKRIHKETRVVRNCIVLSGRWVSGISKGLHCDQPSPRQYYTPMAGNPSNPAVSLHAIFRHRSHWVNSRNGERRGAGAESSRK